MSSILTNMSAMSALQNLAVTQKNLSTIQSQISTGLKVANASDNAAYWSISTSMKSDTSALSAVTNALNLGYSVVSTATSAMSSVTDILKRLKADLVTAQSAGTDKAQVQTDINAQQSTLKNIIASASFNKLNLLDGSAPATTSIVSSFARTTGGNALGTIAVDTAGLALTGGAAAGGLLGTAITGITTGTASNTTTAVDSTGTVTSSGYYDAGSLLAFDVTSASAADLSTIAVAIDTAITSVTSASAKLGTYTTTINNQLTFVSALTDAITSGVGSLVDADMNEASTRLSALQTQQQLGVQSLSIANQSSQIILKLFQ